MSAATAMQVSPAQTVGRIAAWALRFIGLVIVYFILFASGGAITTPYLPTTPAEPGPLPQMAALVLVCAATVLIVMWAIHSSRWHGWKLMLALSVAVVVGSKVVVRRSWVRVAVRREEHVDAPVLHLLGRGPRA